MANDLSWGELMIARAGIKETAKREGRPVEEVRKGIREAIAEARKSTDPRTAAKWADSPFGDRDPLPEEFVAWCARLLRENKM